MTPDILRNLANENLNQVTGFAELRFVVSYFISTMLIRRKALVTKPRFDLLLKPDVLILEIFRNQQSPGMSPLSRHRNSNRRRGCKVHPAPQIPHSLRNHQGPEMYLLS